MRVYRMGSIVKATLDELLYYVPEALAYKPAGTEIVIRIDEMPNDQYYRMTQEEDEEWLTSRHYNLNNNRSPQKK